MVFLLQQLKQTKTIENILGFKFRNYVAVQTDVSFYRRDDPISEDGNPVCIVIFLVNFLNYFRIVGDKMCDTTERW